MLWPFFNWVICLFITELYTALIFNLSVELVSNEKHTTSLFILFLSFKSQLVVSIQKFLPINPTQWATFLNNEIKASPF